MPPGGPPLLPVATVGPLRADGTKAAWVRFTDHMAAADLIAKYDGFMYFGYCLSLQMAHKNFFPKSVGISPKPSAKAAPPGPVAQASAAAPPAQASAAAPSTVTPMSWLEGDDGVGPSADAPSAAAAAEPLAESAEAEEPPARRPRVAYMKGNKIDRTLHPQ